MMMLTLLSWGNKLLRKCLLRKCSSTLRI